MTYDFEQLRDLKNSELEGLMRDGAKPELAQVAGYEFRGFNLQRLTALIGTRKFKKGFYGSPEEGHLWGYNVRVVQNEFHEPWRALPGEANPGRILFFKVFPAEPVGRDAEYANSLVIDYSKWDGYSILNPGRYILDYLVFPNPENQNLLLGKSYFAVGGSRAFAGYFILERHNQSDFR